MTQGVGVLRSKESLEKALQELDRISKKTTTDAGIDSWETTNLFLLAKAIVLSALMREESRGSHHREDFPGAQDRWLIRLEQKLVNGEFVIKKSPLTFQSREK